MTDTQALLATPFVSSWLGHARPGVDRLSGSHSQRRAGWAHWAVTHLTEITSTRRTYPAIWLDGSFYPPKDDGSQVAPHLEIPAKALTRADAVFADRLAAAGNTLAFNWWRFSEVTAVRRALFNYAKGDITGAVARLDRHRDGIIAAYEQTAAAAADAWPLLEETLASDPGALADAYTSPFSTEDVTALFPSANDWHITFDGQLKEVNKQWVARRVGVWTLHGTDQGEPFGLGVCTPRLTKNSTFSDRQYRSDVDTSAALLVRTLVLRRLLASRGISGPAPVVTRVHDGAAPHLQARPATTGRALPTASVPSAVHFVQTFPNANDAWEALTRWASDEYTLTVTRAAFVAAHRRAAYRIARADEPERADIDTVLPIAWHEQGRVVRVTFSRPQP